MIQMLCQAISKETDTNYEGERICETSQAWQLYGVPTKFMLVECRNRKGVVGTVIDIFRLAFIAKLDLRRLMLTGLEAGLYFRALVSQTKEALTSDPRIEKVDFLEVRDIFSGRAAQMLGLKFVATLSPIPLWEGNGADIITKYLLECESMTITGALKVFVQSGSEALFLSKRHGMQIDHFVVSPHWVDFRFLSAINYTRPSRLPYFVVFCGHSQEGIVCILKALTAVCDLDVDIWVVGIPNFRVALARIIREMNLIPRVRLREFRHRHEVIPVLQNAAGVIWSLGKAETANAGCAVTVPETMAVGVPVITSKSLNWDSPVRDGETGYVFEAENSVELAAIIRMILQGDTERVSSVARNASREVADNYTFEKWAQSRLEVLAATGKFECFGEVPYE
jgi:glycosyltransferase involved in cell wall biosynthesis